ncbi:putative oxidoreductase [Agrobacterium rubi TR3 = NBRC 13261]|uniref:Putative oxidoreductase n=2 Tax=Agrobacterium rubi TaxID=28099 RepID=A0A081CPK2_9HYPH|nr:putative oxidoreductase [Agrobacterium rubi TR3 = NBRC 13261]
MGKGSSTGSVINTASFLAGMGSATAQMAFNAAKAGVEQLSRDLGVQLACSNVRLNSFAIGPIETSEIRTKFDRIGPEQAARRFTHMPMGRFGTLEKLASTAGYLASDNAGFLTASSFPLNGRIPEMPSKFLLDRLRATPTFDQHTNSKEMLVSSGPQDVSFKNRSITLAGIF